MMKFEEEQRRRVVLRETQEPKREKAERKRKAQSDFLV